MRGELRDRGAQLILAGGRDTAGGQQRGAQDQPRTESLVLLAGQAPVVVGERIQGEVLDESVQADRHLRTPGEVLLDDRLVDGEQVAGQSLARLDLDGTDLLHPDP